MVLKHTPNQRAVLEASKLRNFGRRISYGAASLGLSPTFPPPEPTREFPLASLGCPPPTSPETLPGSPWDRPWLLPVPPHPPSGILPWRPPGLPWVPPGRVGHGVFLDKGALE